MKRMNNSRTHALTHLRTYRGFTLIEAVLTIAIIGAGLLGVLYIFSGAGKSTLVSDNSIVAANLAREKMDQIVADRINKGYATTIATSYSDGPVLTNYTRTVTIREINPTITGTSDDFNTTQAGSGYARVTVVVGWTGATDTVKLETLIASYTIP